MLLLLMLLLLLLLLLAEEGGAVFMMAFRKAATRASWSFSASWASFVVVAPAEGRAGVVMACLMLGLDDGGWAAGVGVCYFCTDRRGQGVVRAALELVLYDVRKGGRCVSELAVGRGQKVKNNIAVARARSAPFFFEYGPAIQRASL